MRIGIIGYGSIGKRHCQNLKKHAKQIIVLSQRRDIKSVTAVREWSDFAKRGPYDVIFITNETAKHLATIKKAISLKPRAVFIEKPLSHNKEGISALPKMFKAKNISCWVGYNFHFFKPYQFIRSLIKSNKLGRIFYLRASVGQDLRDWRERDYKLSYSAKKEQGGGVLLDLVHDINYPAWLLGEPLLYRSSVVRKLSKLEINTEDCAESILETPLGTIVSIHQDYLRTTLKTSLEIISEKGVISWDSDSQTVRLQYKDKVISKKIVTERNEMFVAELKFFFAKMKKGNYFSNLEEAIRDMNIIYHIKNYAKRH